MASWLPFGHLQDAVGELAEDIRSIVPICSKSAGIATSEEDRNAAVQVHAAVSTVATDAPAQEPIAQSIGPYVSLPSHQLLRGKEAASVASQEYGVVDVPVQEPIERRIDPYDGRHYTFREISDSCTRLHWAPSQINHYWSVPMKECEAKRQKVELFLSKSCFSKTKANEFGTAACKARSTGELIQISAVMMNGMPLGNFSLDGGEPLSCFQEHLSECLDVSPMMLGLARGRNNICHRGTTVKSSGLQDGDQVTAVITNSEWQEGTRRFLGRLQVLGKQHGHLTGEVVLVAPQADVAKVFYMRRLLPPLVPLPNGMIIECEVLETDAGSQEVCHVDWRPLRNVDTLTTRPEHLDTSILENLQVLLDHLGQRDINSAIASAVDFAWRSWKDSACYVLFILDRVGPILDAVLRMYDGVKLSILACISHMLFDWPQLVQNHALIDSFHAIASALVVDDLDQQMYSQVVHKIVYGLVNILIAEPCLQQFSDVGAARELLSLHESVRSLLDKIQASDGLPEMPHEDIELQWMSARQTPLRPSLRYTT